MNITDTVKKCAFVTLNDGVSVMVDVHWSKSHHSDKSPHDVLHNFINMYFGEITYDYTWLDEIDHLETGALDYLIK